LKSSNLRGFEQAVLSPRSILFSFGGRSAVAFFLGISLFLHGCASVSPRSSTTTPSPTPTSTPALSLSATSFNFNTVVIGQSAPQTLQITNSGAASLNISSVTLQGQQFTVTGPSAPLTVAPSQSVAYTVSFVPTTAGNVSATLQISSNASSSPAAVSLAGVAEKAFAALQVSPTSINFGNLNLQASGTQTVTLQNTGDISTTISGVTVTGAGFGFSNLAPGVSLAPGQSVSFQVRFTPQVAGATTGAVSILSSNLTTPASISVSGIGVTSTSPSPTPTPIQHSVSLSWGPSSSSVAGYRVYRDDGSGLLPLTSAIPNLTYTDATVVSGSTYNYAVTAVDAAGIESPFSNEITAVIPTP
jgi:hypothetical protein